MVLRLKKGKKWEVESGSTKSSSEDKSAVDVNIGNENVVNKTEVRVEEKKNRKAYLLGLYVGLEGE